jgi:hypothetical protein
MWESISKNLLNLMVEKLKRPIVVLWCPLNRLIQIILNTFILFLYDDLILFLNPFWDSSDWGWKFYSLKRTRDISLRKGNGEILKVSPSCGKSRWRQSSRAYLYLFYFLDTTHIYFNVHFICSCLSKFIAVTIPRLQLFLDYW